MRNLALCLLFILGAPQVAKAEEHSARLMLLMRLIDQVPTRAQLIEAGAGRDGRALIVIANDESLQRYPRMRAASSLALFDSPEVRAALVAMIDRTDDVEVAVQALAAFVHLEGASARLRLNALLEHENPVLRSAAARHLERLARAAR